jgi:hypothetical protein
MAPLDEIFRQQLLEQPVEPAERLKLRAAAHAELTQPMRVWRRDARNLVLAAWGLAAALTTVLMVTGNSSASLVLGRLATVIPLMGLAALAAWWAVAPGGRKARAVVVAASVVTMVALVVTRGAGHPGSQPEWFCTVSHLTLGFGPLVLAMVTLRRTAPNVVRSLVAGLAMGTVGAISGEVGCDQGWQHVLVFHLAPWLMLTATSVFVMSRMKRRWSYAP